LGDVCDDNIQTLSVKDDFYIDYIDISSIDNQEKKVVSYQTIKALEAPSRAKQILKKGDILVSTVRPNLNAVAINTLDSENMVVGSTAFCVLRCSERINSNYLYYYCRSKRFVNRLVKLAKGASYPAVSNNDVKSSEIPLPPIEVQEKIANTLDTVAELLALRKQQLDELDNLIKSIFYDMFGDPVVNEKGWEVKKLGDCFQIKSGGTPSTKNPLYWENGDIPWIGSNMCQNDIIYNHDGKYITRLGLEHSNAKMFEKGTVLIALVGATIGKTALLRFNTTTNQNIAGIEVQKNNNFTPEYVFYAVQNHYYRFLSLGNGSFKMANLSFVRNLSILVPPLTLQKKFTLLVNQIEEQKALVKKAIDETQTLFDSLMSQYFD